MKMMDHFNDDYNLTNHLNIVKTVFLKVHTNNDNNDKKLQLKIFL